jgi:hypothetical protein
MDSERDSVLTVLTAQWVDLEIMVTIPTGLTHTVTTLIVLTIHMGAVLDIIHMATVQADLDGEDSVMATVGWATVGTITDGMEMAEVGEVQMEVVKHQMSPIIIADLRV